MERWLEGRARRRSARSAVLEDIRASGDFDLTTLPVALREVRNLIQLRTPA